MKTSRRGGLGRGLGALIQSTAEPVDEAPQEADATAEDATAPTAAPAEKKAATSTARRSSKETSEAKTPAPRAASASKSSGGAAKEAPADKKAGSAGRAPAAAKKAAPTKKASSSAGEAKANSAAAPAAARKTPDRAAQRPVDVFFSPDPEDAPVARRGTKARPAMPTVKAPTKREAASSSGEEAAAGASTAAEGTVSTDIAVLREIPVGDIHPNPRQPREVFDEEHMAELVTSIREVGILQPIVVREVDGPTPYELIMGERRWRATQKAGLDAIPAIVRQTPDHDLLRDALLENLHRSQLNALEEAAAYQQLMEDFACTQEELAERIGRSRPQISNTLRLLKLPPLVQRRVAAGTLSAGHARALLGLTDPSDMERLAQRIQAEGLSVRATEEAVAQLQGGLRPGRTPRRTADDARHERLDHYATALTSRLDTSVKITLGARKGRIAIDFTTVEDLNRIMDVIQGEKAGRGAAS